MDEMGKRPRPQGPGPLEATAAKPFAKSDDTNEVGVNALLNDVLITAFKVTSAQIDIELSRAAFQLFKRLYDKTREGSE